MLWFFGSTSVAIEPPYKIRPYRFLRGKDLDKTASDFKAQKSAWSKASAVVQKLIVFAISSGKVPNVAALEKLDDLASQSVFSVAMEMFCRSVYDAKEFAKIESIGNLTYYTLYQRMRKNCNAAAADEEDGDDS